jgi:hypothetical protein
MRTSRRIILSASAVFCLALTVAGCGSGSGDNNTSTPTANPDVATTNNATASASTPPTTRSSTPQTRAPTATLNSPMPTLAATRYVSDWSSGVNGWTGSKDWSVVESVLLDDGTSDNGSMLAPYFPATRDYSVEAEVQFLRYRPGYYGKWGITIRSGYYVGVCGGCGGNNGEPSIFISNGDTYIANAPHTIDGQFHTYRVEVQSNNIRFLIDGQPVLQATDNTHLDPGRVGLESNDSQISVRVVRIAPLS